jgi:hypothetical protein
VLARRGRQSRPTGRHREPRQEDTWTIPRWAALAILEDRLAPPGKLRLVDVSKAEAVAFVARHHATRPRLNVKGLLYALGVRRGDRLVAVATLTTPAAPWRKRLPQSQVVELSRVASDGTTEGAASKLVSRLLDLATQAIADPEKPWLFVTYQYVGERGDTYRALADKGLRPVARVGAETPHGARAGSEVEAVPKVRWEAGPAALPADWNLIR